jgi:signal transduction histidine kinase/ligand-binding sensor domain-containing protein
VRIICLSIAALALGWSDLTRALNPEEGLSEYKHLVWRSGDQGLVGHGSSVAQSADGYLWVGTTAGLFRFDGVRFTEWKAHGASIGLAHLIRATDGSLWISASALSDFSGPGSGVMRVKDRKIETIDPSPRVSVVTEDEKGIIWYVKYHRQVGTGELCSWGRGVGTRCQPSPYRLSGLGVVRSFEDAIWIGSDNALVRFQDGKFTNFPVPGLAPYTNQEGVTALLPDGQGGLLVGMQSPGGGLQRLKDNRLTPVGLRGIDATGIDVMSLFKDREGALWIGTVGDGIYRIYDERVDHYAAASDSTNEVLQFAEDQEGSIWFASVNGLERFSDRRVVTVVNEENFHSPQVDGVSLARDGTLWVAGVDTLLSLAPGSHTFTAPAIIPHNALTTTIFEDHTGAMWVGINNTLNRLEGHRFIPLKLSTGAPLGMIASLAEDHAFNLWAVSLGPPRQILKIDAARLHVTPVPNLPPASRVAADPTGGIYVVALNGDLIHVDALGGEVVYPHPAGHSGRIPQISLTSDGTVYASTSFGLEMLRKGKIQVLDTRNGLPCKELYEGIFDRYENLWLYAQCGVVRIAGKDLARWVRDPAAVIPMQLLDAEDGAAPYDAPFGGSAKTLDGVLWFANEANLQKIDPDSVARPGNPPPVHLEQFTADGKRYDTDEPIKLPPSTGNIQIDYTGLSFVVPDKVRFHYKLDGFDRSWTDAGPRRQAFYTTLPPGNYRFHVIASNNNGVWNDVGASLTFVISPAFVQTGWFLALCVTGGAAAVWSLVRLRVRQVRGRLEERMEVRLNERTRIARELHDSLLQGFQGLMFRLQAVRQLLPERPGDAVKFLDSAMQVGDQAIGEGRDAVENLRSSSFDSDLATSLSALDTELGARIDAHSRPEYRVVAEGRSRELTAVVRDEAYRIAREAVSNAYRHAKARHIETEVTFGNADLTIRVRDDGIGVDPEVLARGQRPGHWGLPGMRERSESFGGHLRVWSEGNAGTEVELLIPAHVAYARPPASIFSRLRNSFR